MSDDARPYWTCRGDGYRWHLVRGMDAYALCGRKAAGNWIQGVAGPRRIDPKCRTCQRVQSDAADAMERAVGL